MQNVEPYGPDPNVVVVIQRLDLGAEREAVQRVRVEGVFRVVHRQRPEALCRRQLAFGEGDCIRLVDQQLGWRVMGGVDEPKALLWLRCDRSSHNQRSGAEGRLHTDVSRTAGHSPITKCCDTADGSRGGP